MPIERAQIAFVVAIVCGATLWIASAFIIGRREPWDSALYWKPAYPIATALAGLLGYLVPEQPWRWALPLMLSQFATMAIKDGLGGMWPMGQALFTALALPGIALANLASRFRVRHSKNEL